MAGPEDHVAGLYERHARAFDRDRSRTLAERGWLDAFLVHVSPGGVVLDLGCGGGEPIARYIVDQGFDVAGVDTSPTLLGLCQARLPDGEWLVGDMRRLALGRRFDGVVAWDSFFHLAPDDQRSMFARIADHARDGAPLLFTSGTEAGVSMGAYRGEPLYHVSLDESEYGILLADHGFGVVTHTADDPDSGGHTVWLARYRG